MSEATSAQGGRLKFQPGKPIVAQSDQDNGIVENALLMGIDLGEYRNAMRRRSAKWETVSLPAEEFRSLARPLESWL